MNRKEDFNKGGLIMRKLLFIVLLFFCSCTGNLQSDGVVISVEQYGYYDCTFKVCVKKFTAMPVIDGGNYYWFLTNDTLQIGDTIHIGKVK